MAEGQAFEVKGKTAIVTGAGSGELNCLGARVEAKSVAGINYCFAKLLLEQGCNVLIADLTLRPEAEALVSQYTSNPRANFQKTDVTSWTSLSALFSRAASDFGEVDIVCPGAGVYDPLWSNFWYPPGSEESKDSEQGDRYATLDINVTHPIRTTQLAIAEFLKNQKKLSSGTHGGGSKGWGANKKQKRVLIVSSIAGQNANLHTPIYVAAKHAMYVSLPFSSRFVFLSLPKLPMHF